MFEIHFNWTEKSNKKWTRFFLVLIFVRFFRMTKAIGRSILEIPSFLIFLINLLNNFRFYGWRRPARSRWIEQNIQVEIYDRVLYKIVYNNIFEKKMPQNGIQYMLKFDYLE